VIHFQCGHCGVRIKVPDTQIGRNGRCPHCRQAITVPPGPTGGQEHPRDPKARSVDPAHDTALLDVAPKGEVPDETTSRGQVCAGPAEDVCEPGERRAQQQAGPTDVVRLPWPIDAMLYPLSIMGLVHLVSLWLLLFYLCPFIMSLGLSPEYVPFVYTLPVGYAVYYFAECIRHRVGGGCRVPEYWMHPCDSSKWDCLTQMYEVVGCIAVCFWPVSVYYIVREQVDWVYWLLLAGGGFLFPMVLLGVVLFDSFSALNPVLIGGSILRTLVPYCGTVLLLWAGALLSARIGFHLNGFYPLPTVYFLLWLVQLYLVFVAIAWLGSFYRRHKEKLDWDI
jgi:predicted Zn finger-like uncharacterized protein